MVDYVDAGELTRRIRAFAFGGHAPEEIVDELQTIPGVAADVICQAGEILFAHLDLLDVDGFQLVGEIYQHALQQGWTGFNQGDRSEAIVALVRAGADMSDEWPAPHVALRDGHDWRVPDQVEVAEPETSDPP